MKTYKADTLNEAMSQVKSDLGPEAVILKTKKSRQNFLGKNREVIEVTAALEDKLYEKPSKVQEEVFENSAGIYSRAGVNSISSSHKTEQLNKPLRPNGRHTLNGILSPERFNGNRNQEVRSLPTDETLSPHFDKQIEKLHGDFKKLLTKVTHIEQSLEQLDYEKIIPEFQPLYHYLIRCDFGDLMARELMVALANVVPESKRNDRKYVEKVLKRIVSNRIQKPHPFRIKKGRSNLFFLVGTTGVGKSTTISKLCGVYHYEKNLKVGVISIDHYKLGAYEQMFLLCRSMDVPFESVYTSSEFETALDNLSDCDVIFVDTYGGVLSDNEKLLELNTLIEKYKPEEVVLTLSCTMRSKDQLSIYSKFKDSKVSSFVFSKVDESDSLGCVYQTSLSAGVPISYLGNGPQVPDNLLEAESSELASMILKSGGVFESY